jgi:hypothetical protein
MTAIVTEAEAEKRGLGGLGGSTRRINVETTRRQPSSIEKKEMGERSRLILKEVTSSFKAFLPEGLSARRV